MQWLVLKARFVAELCLGCLVSIHNEFLFILNVVRVYTATCKCSRIMIIYKLSNWSRFEQFMDCTMQSFKLHTAIHELLTLNPIPTA